MGFPFTWHKNCVDYNIWEWLDRALAINEWFRMFPGTKVQHLNTTVSDHRLIWINPEGMETHFQKSFCFDQMWMTDKGCGETIEAMWIENSLEPWDTRVLKNIDKCGHELLHWSKRHFGNVRRELEKKRKELQQAKRFSVWTGDSRRMRVLELEINMLLDKEAQMWRQRSRILWMKDGDHNTKFFHSKASQWRRRNYITKLYDSRGRWCTRQSQVNDTILEFYRELFTSANLENLANVLEVIP